MFAVRSACHVYSTQDDRTSSLRQAATVVYRFLESSARARERTQKAALLKLEKIEKSVDLVSDVQFNVALIVM